MNECWARFSPLIRSLARELGCHGADLDDATQEVLIELWRVAHRFDELKGTATTFVATIARRRFIDRLRKRRRNREVVDLTDATGALRTASIPQDPVASAEESERVVALFQQLRPEQREVLTMAVRRGLTHEEIAQTTGLPLGTVKTHTRRGLIRLRELVAEADGGATDPGPPTGTEGPKRNPGSLAV